MGARHAPPIYWGCAMRLAEFIVANRATIMTEWEAFARTCAPASGSMDIVALSDHASEMLTVIAADLRTPQGSAAQSAKSMGHAPDDASLPSTPAEQHGAGRAVSGFTVGQMVAEYRALRASIIRLWTSAVGELERSDIDDLTRFNEAIDQSLAESVSEYSLNLEHSKEIFVGILGHDLRTPLSAMRMSAEFMLDLGELTEPSLMLTTRMVRSATRMNRMIGDLLDFTRGHIGGGIPIARAEASMGKILHEVVDEVAAAFPDCVIDVDTRTEQLGMWDAARVSQALTNLVANAAQHGAPGTTITVVLRDETGSVAISIHNRGRPIPGTQLDGLFSPMKIRDPETAASSAGGPTGSLGLGLYIAERIVAAHGGHIDVASSEAAGTTFTVHLPRGN
jgi:signal transduction histidine kinase